MDTAESFLVYKKTAYIYNVIADIKTKFSTSNYELEGPLLKRKLKSNWINER